MQQQHDEEALLWTQFKNGDREAFAMLYRKHILSLIAYGTRLCPDRHTLKDQIQELFVELWNSRENLSHTDAVKFYLFRALRYKLVRQAKTRHHHAAADRVNAWLNEPRQESSIETSIVEREIQSSYTALLKDAISHLTARQQEIIQLRFYQGFSHEQIAELLNINHQSVSNLLYRALCSLKEKISIPAFAIAPFLALLGSL